MEELFIQLATQHPIVMGVFAFMGILRAINKPLFALLHSLVQSTDTDADNKILQEVEQSKAYKFICFLLDWSLSVKIPPKKQ